MWPSRGGGGGGNTNAPYSPFEDDSNEKSYAAKLYTKKKKKNYTNNGLLFNGYNNNTNNNNNNNNRKGVKIIGGVLLLMTILRVFWSSRLSATNTTNRTSGFRHVDKYDREGNAKSMMDGGNGVVVDGNNEYYDVNNDSDDSDGKKTKKTKKNLWSRATNDAPRSSRVSSQKVAANLVIDHLGRALAPMISKYVDIDEDGAVDANELERFAERVGGVENVGKGFTSAVLAALTATWGDAESGGQHNRPIEKTPCALEFNRGLSTGAELEVTSDVQFKGVKPFCVEAWVKPSDAETTRNGFQGYGGAIFAKKMSDEMHPDDDETDVLLMDEDQKKGGKNVGRGQFTFALDDAGGLTFMRETGLTTALRSKRHLKPNSYTHVAASYGFGDASIFINGTLDATRKEGAILRGDDVTPLTIGMLLDRKGRSRLGFTGTIQEVRLWNRPCDKESMKRYYERRLVGWEPGLTAYWPMNDCFGKILAEKRGEYRGRVTGRAAWRRNGHHLMTDDDIELCKHLAKGVIDESLA